MRRLTTVAAVLSLTGAALVAAPAQGATTYKACVKKSSGEVRMLAKGKKCSKGWKKVSWKKTPAKGDPGTAGPQGPGGPSAKALGVLVDGNSAVIGTAVGMGLGSLSQFQVQIDGGIYGYLANGWLYPSPSLSYATPTCTDTPFLPTSTGELVSFFTQDPQVRFVQRNTTPVLGPSTAFKPTGTTDPILNLQTYRKSSAGVCQLGPMQSGQRINMVQVPAPADRPGPLRIL